MSYKKVSKQRLVDAQMFCPFSPIPSALVAKSGRLLEVSKVDGRFRIYLLSAEYRLPIWRSQPQSHCTHLAQYGFPAMKQQVRNLHCSQQEYPADLEPARHRHMQFPCLKEQSTNVQMLAVRIVDPVYRQKQYQPICDDIRDGERLEVFC